MGRHSNERKRGSRWRRTIAVALAWILAASLAGAAGTSKAGAAVESFTFTSITPADGSRTIDLSRLEVSAEAPEGDAIHNAGYRIKRLSDGKYLYPNSDPALQWTDDESYAGGLMYSDGGGKFHWDMAQYQKEAMDDGTYEVRFFVNDDHGSNYRTVAFTLDRTAPHLANATVQKDILDVTFSEPLTVPDGESWDASDFDVRVNGVSVPIDAVIPVQNEPEILVKLQSPVSKTDSVTIAYTGNPPFANEAGTAVSNDRFNVVNGTPGTFQDTPVLRMRLEAGHALRAGEPLVRFVPTSDGANDLEFDLPSEPANSPAVSAGRIAKTDFVIEDVGDGTQFNPGAAMSTSDSDNGIYNVILVLPTGKSLLQGHTYELKMSASAGGDEIVMPANPTSNASAYLRLLNTAGAVTVIDEYTFEKVAIAEKQPVDFSALETAISDAQAKADAATEGLATGEYEPGAKDELQAAINAAAEVRDNAASTQEDVDAALTALTAAVDAFEGKRVVVNLDALSKEIDDAQSKLDAAVEGEATGNYEAGAKDELQAAIHAAAEVRDNAASTQEDVDAALTALTAAVDAFEGKRVVVNLDALSKEINDAQSKLDAAVEGGAAGNYEAGAKDELQAAIEAATAVWDNAASTQDDVDAAVAALGTAVDVFGAKLVVIDLTELADAISDAQTEHDDAVEGGATGNYEAGAKDELKAAIDAAAEVRDNAASTQEDLNAALTALIAAIDAFESKRVVVELTALTNTINAAQAKLDATVEGSAIGNYKAGAKTALQAAIQAAATVKNNATSTQEQVDAALTALNEAVAAFEAKKVTSEETPGGSNPGGGSAPGNGGAGSVVQPSTSSYTLDVTSGGVRLGSLSVKRTTGTDGRVTDAIELPDAFAEQAVNQLKKAGLDRLILSLPASQSAGADELEVALPSAAANRIASEGFTLDIRTAEAGLSVPPASLHGTNEPLTFRIAPARNAADQSDIARRANGSPTIRALAGTGDVTLIGQPVSIETELRQRQVTVTLPLPDHANLQDAGVYIEHSDGTTELVRGRVLEPTDGSDARTMAFDVDKFSTFSIVNVAGWTAYEQAPKTKLRNIPYMSGYAGGLFKPNASLTRAEMAAILSRLVIGEAGGASGVFSDVPSSSWASGVIRQVVELGIMSGNGNGAFLPDKPITRAEMAAIVSRLLPHAEAVTDTGNFSDTSGHWALSAILKARAAGLMNGYVDGTFRPDQALSRAEAAVILNKLIGRPSGSNDRNKPFFADVPRTNWAFAAIQAASGR
ncbi:S-layer homology domain-containing protein [Cohnella zeiphila]|uniref:S-layer homology domain-containing protein n=1 Tax=Cohnella zeiphila TaxID=2761120 RepID=A0A7X0SH22_9BACL|nr:S-layer homology domain-containing protein [Cohnella zeiphila]MBB6729837.1 S-layer homology domain-containing protein [Cohnella zeiphila]